MNAASVGRLLTAVAECREAGWPVHGGTRLSGELKHGYFVEPTVVEVPLGSSLLRDEAIHTVYRRGGG